MSHLETMIEAAQNSDAARAAAQVVRDVPLSDGSYWATVVVCAAVGALIAGIYGMGLRARLK